MDISFYLKNYNNKIWPFMPPLEWLTFWEGGFKNHRVLVLMIFLWTKVGINHDQ